MAMIEAYKIGIEMVIAGDANTKMREFTKVMNTATRANNKFTKSLTILNEAFTKTGVLIEGLGPKTEAFGVGLANSLRVANVEMSSLNRKMAESSLMGGGGGRGFHVGGLGHHMGRDIGGGFGGIAGGGLASFAGPVGLGLLGVGMAGMAGFHKYSEMQNAIAQLQAQGFSPAANASLVNQARTANIPGVSRISMMEAISDSAVVTKDAGMASALAPTVAKMLFADKALFGQLGQSFSRADERNLLQAAEMKTGSRDPKVIAATMNMFQKLLTAEGGPARMPTAYFSTFMRRAQASGRTLSDAGFVEMAPLMQMMKGMTAGRQMRGMTSALLGGSLSKVKRSEWERLGIMDPNKVQQNIIGQTVGIGADAVKNANLLTTNPVEWILTVLKPALKKAGITSKTAQTQEFFRLLPQAYTGILSQALENEGKIRAMQRQFVTSAGIGGSFSKALNIPAGRTKEMTQAFTDLGIAFGHFSSPVVLLGMKMLTEAARGLTTMFTVAAHPLGAAKSANTKLVNFFSGLWPTHQKTTSLLGGVKTSKPVPVKSSSGGSHIFMDGRKVGEILQKHEMTAAGFPPSHGSDIDFRQTLVPTQLNAVR